MNLDRKNKETRRREKAEAKRREKEQRRLARRERTTRGNSNAMST